jgi:hypothetical protein
MRQMQPGDQAVDALHLVFPSYLFAVLLFAATPPERSGQPSLGTLLYPFNDDRDSLAAADAHRYAGKLRCSTKSSNPVARLRNRNSGQRSA